mmetsp:Transcript_96746/g.230255  ORF Transcript_96746/g.230255 Transcript_96746/m.230255 type:complete len:207 (-) Transcript_96746:747-1367(-)
MASCRLFSFQQRGHLLDAIVEAGDGPKHTDNHANGVQNPLVASNLHALLPLDRHGEDHGQDEHSGLASNSRNDVQQRTEEGQGVSQQGTKAQKEEAGCTHGQALESWLQRPVARAKRCLQRLCQGVERHREGKHHMQSDDTVGHHQAPVHRLPLATWATGEANEDVRVDLFACHGRSTDCEASGCHSHVEQDDQAVGSPGEAHQCS